MVPSDDGMMCCTNIQFWTRQWQTKWVKIQQLRLLLLSSNMRCMEGTRQPHCKFVRTHSNYKRWPARLSRVVLIYDDNLLIKMVTLKPLSANPPTGENAGGCLTHCVHTAAPTPFTILFSYVHAPAYDQIHHAPFITSWSHI